MFRVSEIVYPQLLTLSYAAVNQAPPLEGRWHASHSILHNKLCDERDGGGE